MFLEIKHIFENNMSYVSLTLGLIQKDKQVKLDLPKNYASQYMKRLPYIENEDTNFQNTIIHLVNNRMIFKSTYLLRAGMEILFKKKSILLRTMGSIIMQWCVEH